MLFFTSLSCPRLNNKHELLSCHHVLFILHLQTVSSISLTADDDRLNADSFYVQHSLVPLCWNISLSLNLYMCYYNRYRLKSTLGHSAFADDLGPEQAQKLYLSTY